MNITKFSLVLVIVFLGSCASTNDQDDPLKNTKRLVKEGHVSLYNNGALNVPNTKIKLIPPGPDAVGLAMELSGIKARESFLRSIMNARDAVYLVRNGTRKSFRVAGDISKKTNEITNHIRRFSRTNSQLLIYRAYPDTKQIIGESFQLSARVSDEINQLAINIRKDAELYATKAQDRHELYEGLAGASVGFAIRGVTKSSKDVKEDIRHIGNKFIKGYVILPRKWKARRLKQKNDINYFKKNWQASLSTREKLSGKFTNIILNTSNKYGENISQSLNKSKSALENAGETGVGFAALDSMRWLLHALLWDATIAPVSKVGVSTIGFVASNTVVFPVMVVVGESAAVSKVAVEQIYHTGRKTVDIVAPTFHAALASTYAVSSFAVKSVGSVVVGGAGVVASATVGVVDSFSALTIQTTGSAIGYGVEYVGVPLSTAGIKTTGTMAGVVVGATESLGGTGLLVSGEASALATTATGYTAAGSVAVVGSTGSAVVGSTLGVYEVAKSIAVPSSYQLGSGIVLGYSSMSHLAAHSILGVADASYLVLSLEGPKWVVYAVKGNLGSGDDILPGTVLDLESMQTQGESFSVLNASDREIDELVESLQSDLPFEDED